MVCGAKAQQIKWHGGGGLSKRKIGDSCLFLITIFAHSDRAQAVPDRAQAVPDRAQAVPDSAQAVSVL